MNNLLLKSLERQKVYKEGFYNKNNIFPRIQINEEKKKEFVENSLIKIVAGPRRAGKSTYLFSLLEGKDFAYVNFDDVEILNSYTSINELLELLGKVYGSTRTVLFDEIQNIPK